MPRVQLKKLEIQPGYNKDDFNLFLPFCIHVNEGKNEGLEYDTEYFKQTIKQTQKAYPGKMLHILVADTLDRHNRTDIDDNSLTEDQLNSMSESERDARDKRIVDTARADGDSWLAIYEPVLQELGLVAEEKDTTAEEEDTTAEEEDTTAEEEDTTLEEARTRGYYKIHRWDDFLSPARESGYLQRFEKMAKKRGVINIFRSMAKKYQESARSNYRQLPQKEKLKLVDISTKYYLEDYGVTFFIANQHRPVLFFADKQNKATMEVFRQCNALSLNEDGGFAHLQLREDIQFVRNETASPVNGNRALFFKRGIDIQGIVEQLQALNEIKAGILTAHNETQVQLHAQLQAQLYAQLKPLDEAITKLTEQLDAVTKSQQNHVSTTTLAK